MRFRIIAETDKGIYRKNNQDSLIVKYGYCLEKEIVMAVVCDGMGGLSRGELASATVVRAFSKWFDEELSYEIKELNLQIIASKWILLLKELNITISEYAKLHNIKMGTTFTGMLIVDEEYLIVHIGDTRAYYIGQQLKQITRDHTLVSKEVERGTMTLEQALKDKRKSVLTQCIGASDMPEPDVIYGETQSGIYLLCSDGLVHEVTEYELQKSLNINNLYDERDMTKKLKSTIELVKKRGEKDNISGILIKVK